MTIMKKFNFYSIKRFSLLTLFALVTMVFYTSCEKEELNSIQGENLSTTINEAESTLTLEQAQAWFENQKLKSGEVENFGRIGECYNFFSNTSRKEKWNLATQSATDKFDVLEMPISYEDGSNPVVLLKDIRETSLKIGEEYKGEYGQGGFLLRLVILQDKVTKKLYQAIMKIIPDPSYNVANLENNTLMNTESDFSGHISYLRWDGSFLGGIVRIITDEKPNCENTKVASSRDVICKIEWYTIITTSWTSWTVNGEKASDTNRTVTTTTYTVKNCSGENGTPLVTPTGSGGSRGGSGIKIITEGGFCGQDGEAHCPTCTDEEQNGTETGVDCGGDDCLPCEEEEEEEEDFCSDGIKNNGETGVDCGGSCKVCEEEEEEKGAITGLCMHSIFAEQLPDAQGYYIKMNDLNLGWIYTDTRGKSKYVSTAYWSLCMQVSGFIDGEKINEPFISQYVGEAFEEARRLTEEWLDENDPSGKSVGALIRIKFEATLIKELKARFDFQIEYPPSLSKDRSACPGIQGSIPNFSPNC